MQQLDRGNSSPAGLGAFGGLSGAHQNRPPLSPKEAWLSDGRQVLHFRPTRRDRWCEQWKTITSELLPEEPLSTAEASPATLQGIGDQALK